MIWSNMSDPSAILSSHRLHPGRFPNPTVAVERAQAAERIVQPDIVRLREALFRCREDEQFRRARAQQPPRDHHIKLIPGDTPKAA